MARSKKAADDTVTFKKSELIAKMKEFLEEEDACDGDWLNKARVKFLGEENLDIRVEATIPVSVNLEMVGGKLPSKEEVIDRIQEQMDNGDWCGWDDMDEDSFTITKISRS